MRSEGITRESEARRRNHTVVNAHLGRSEHYSFNVNFDRISDFQSFGTLYIPLLTTVTLSVPTQSEGTAFSPTSLVSVLHILEGAINLEAITFHHDRICPNLLRGDEQHALFEAALPIFSNLVDKQQRKLKNFSIEDVVGIEGDECWTGCDAQCGDCCNCDEDYECGCKGCQSCELGEQCFCSRVTCAHEKGFHQCGDQTFDHEGLMQHSDELQALACKNVARGLTSVGKTYPATSREAEVDDYGDV